MANHDIWTKLIDLKDKIAPHLAIQIQSLPKDLYFIVDNLSENSFISSPIYIKLKQSGFDPLRAIRYSHVAKALNLIEAGDDFTQEMKVFIIKCVFEVLKETLREAKSLQAAQIGSEVNMIWLGAPCPEKYLDNIVKHAQSQSNSRHIIWCDSATLDYMSILFQTIEPYCSLTNLEFIDWHQALEPNVRKLPSNILQDRALLKKIIELLKQEDPAYASNILRNIILAGNDYKRQFPVKVYYDVDNRPSLESLAGELLTLGKIGHKKILVNCLIQGSPLLKDSPMYAELFDLKEDAETGLKFQIGSMAVASGDTPMILKDLIDHQIKGSKILMKWKVEGEENILFKQLIETNKINYESFRSVHSATNAIVAVTAGKEESYLGQIKKMSLEHAARHEFDNTHKPDRFFIYLMKENIRLLDKCQLTVINSSHALIQTVQNIFPSVEPTSYEEKKILNDRLQWFNITLLLFLMTQGKKNTIDTIRQYVKNSQSGIEPFLDNSLVLLEQKRQEASSKPLLDDFFMGRISTISFYPKNRYIENALMSLGHDRTLLREELNEDKTGSLTAHIESKENIPLLKSTNIIPLLTSCCERLAVFLGAKKKGEDIKNKKKND